MLFAREVVGGALFGLAIGYAAYRMLASVDHYQVEILLTLALVMGGYALAIALHVSGPIAIVVAGVLIGNHGRKYAMSARTPRAPRQLLGAARRDPERGAVRDDRPGAAAPGLRRHLRLGRGARHSRRAARAVPVGVARRAGAGPAPGLPALRHRHPHLGRPARRHLGRPRALAAHQPVPRRDHHRDLRGGPVLDPGAGTDAVAAGRAA